MKGHFNLKKTIQPQNVCKKIVVCYFGKPFGSPSTGGTVTYSWINSNPAIGLTASGTGNIASYVIRMIDYYKISKGFVVPVIK